MIEAMDATITLSDYINKDKKFVIPEYQRGYIWGKKRNNPGEADSVSFIMDSIISKFRSKSNVFLQGVTVTESHDSIVLIDGQQRTTFLYILLRRLGFKGKFEIQYDVRGESGDFIKNLSPVTDTEDNADEEYQDIYFFKETCRIIERKLEEGGISEENYPRLIDFLLHNIRFLFIAIPASQAKKVFTMMNGNRAKMLEQEVIKAEILRLVSLNEKKNDTVSYEWELNMLRSRFAREWDKWLHWWNRKDVAAVFTTLKYGVNDFVASDQMGWLLVSVMGRGAKNVTFESFFRNIIPENNASQSERLRNKKTALEAFDRLRRAQKRFEDAFDNPVFHNMAGAVLRVINSDDRVNFIQYFFGNNNNFKTDILKKYYLCAFLGMTHLEITGMSFEKKFVEKFNARLEMLMDPLIFENVNNGGKEAAYQLLLRFNIDEDNVQNQGKNIDEDNVQNQGKNIDEDNVQNQRKGRKFDFYIWGDEDRTRSLEHIYPKSKVLHKDEEGRWLKGDNKEYKESDQTDPHDDSGYIIRSDIGSVTYICNVDESRELKQDEITGLFIPTKELKETEENERVIDITEHSLGNLVLLYFDDNATFNNRNFEGKKQIFLVGEENGDKREVFKSRHLLHTIYHFAEPQWGASEIKKYYIRTLNEFKKPYQYLIDPVVESHEQN